MLRVKCLLHRRIRDLVLRLLRFQLERNRYLRSLPALALLPLFAAVFFTFAVLGFVIDLGAFGSRPFREVLLIAAYAGGVTVFILWVVLRRHRYMWLAAIAAVLSSIAFFSRFPDRSVPPQNPDVERLRVRIATDASAISFLVYGGYTLFIIFISLEGLRSMRLKTEMDLAKGVHARLVPAVEVASRGFQIYGRSIPSSEVGGDLIDVVEAGDQIFCYLADVSGHGVAAGVLMGMVKSVARTTLLHSCALEQMLSDLNAVLPHVKDASMFATFACLRLDGSSQAQYALAGHLPILHYSWAAGRVSRLELPQFPLGLFPAAQFRASTLPFTPGDLFVLVTDGIPDTADFRDREFGLERVEQIVEQHAAAPLAELFDRIIQPVTQHGKQTDDRSLLLVRC